MPRAARVAPNEYVYHVLTRGNNRQNVFKGEEDFERYVEIVKKYKEKYEFKLYHYVLMSNHVHLVLETTGDGGSLAEVMKGINLSYAQHYKRKYKHIGHFWQDRYKSIIVSKDEYLLACGSYVELNPVRARIVDDPKEYQWSSYGAYAFGKGDLIVDEHSIYEQLSESGPERRRKYREFVKGMLMEREAMSGEMERKVVYGNEDFAAKMKKRFALEEIIRKKGRPRKEENDGK
ncbi:MAG: transposase [Nitrospirota bacterium]